MFDCRNHPGADAAWLCGTCEGYLCDDCVAIRQFGRTAVETCKSCGDMVTAVARGITVSESGSSQSLAGAFSFPLKGSGPLILLGGTIVVSLLGTISSLIGWGLFLGYGMTIIQRTGEGREDAPDWPDVNGIGDLIRPVFFATATAAIAFGPALWLGLHSGSTAWVAALTVAGAAYAPMAWIAVSVSERVLAITPITVLPLLFRVNGTYWIACAVLLVTVVVGSVGIGFVETLAPGILAVLLSTAASLYLVMVEMRILGLVWQRNREEFGVS